VCGSHWTRSSGVDQRERFDARRLGQKAEELRQVAGGLAPVDAGLLLPGRIPALHQHVDDGDDLSIRQGTLPESRLIGRKLEDATLGAFAAPADLQRRGTPKTLADLKAHDCIQFVLPSTGRPMAWIFNEAGAEVDFAFSSRQRVHEDVLGCVNWAFAGCLTEATAR
jgi:hypothetical protein